MDRGNIGIGFWWIPNCYIVLQLGGGHYEGSNVMVKHDEYRFIFVNFKHLIPLLAQSFAFPMHLQ
jgi:hypothetical protein